MPQWPTRWMVGDFIHGRRDLATHQRRPFVNQIRGSRYISSSKASQGNVVSCRVVSGRTVPGRSYFSFSTKTRRTPPRFMLLSLYWPQQEHFIFTKKSCYGNMSATLLNELCQGMKYSGTKYVLEEVTFLTVPCELLNLAFLNKL